MAMSGARTRTVLAFLPGLAATVLVLGAGASAPHGLLLKGEEAEKFLRSAQVVRKKGLSVGVTRSYQLTLTDGSRTLKAAWKVINEYKPGITQFAQGGFEVEFRDSYKYEIAAYELDKLLGLDLVPPTVERVIDGQRGSVQEWVEGAMTEADRKKNGVKVPDSTTWNEQIYKVRLMHQLTYNTDHANIRNILLDPDFRVYAIDFSRSFRTYDKLLSEKDLTRFSRAALERLRALDRATLQEKLGPYLRGVEIDGLMKRKDVILALAERMVAQEGEATVLY